MESGADAGCWDEQAGWVQGWLVWVWLSAGAICVLARPSQELTGLLMVGCHRLLGLFDSWSEADTTRIARIRLAAVGDD